MTEGRQKRLQLSNKIFINTASNLHNFNIAKHEKHCRRIYYEQNSCKAAEIAASRSLNMLSFSSCVMQRRKCPI